MSSEGERLSGGGKYEVASAKPAELAALINEWENDRPALMQGVVWFRLPVPTDKMNWTWDTLQKVMCGETPEGEVELGMEYSTEGLVELYLYNKSKRRVDWPEEVKLTWEKAFCIAHGVDNDYIEHQFDRKESIVLRWRFHEKEAIHPEQKVRIAWFRFDRPQEVMGAASLSKRNILLDEKTTPISK